MASVLLKFSWIMKESGKKFETKKTYESDVDQMLDEVYGHGGVEVFDKMWKKHPEWSLEQALKEYEKDLFLEPNEQASLIPEGLNFITNF